MAVDDGHPISGALTFSNGIPRLTGELIPYAERLRNAAEHFGRRSPALMVDVLGMANGRSDPDFLKKVHSRKMSVWIMTPVVDVDDVFDAFYSGADVLVIPIHMVRSEKVLREVNALSDRCIPALFTQNGRNMNGRGIFETAAMVRDCGYSRIAVIETSGEYDGSFWSALRGIDMKVMPYLANAEDGIVAAQSEFEDIFI